MVSKSANYCMGTSAHPTCVLTLCDVALGSMMERIQAHQHGRKAPVLAAAQPEASTFSAKAEGSGLPYRPQGRAATVQTPAGGLAAALRPR